MARFSKRMRYWWVARRPIFTSRGLSLRKRMESSRSGMRTTWYIKTACIWKSAVQALRMWFLSGQRRWLMRAGRVLVLICCLPVFLAKLCDLYSPSNFILGQPSADLGIISLAILDQGLEGGKKYQAYNLTSGETLTQYTILCPVAEQFEYWILYISCSLGFGCWSSL